MRFPGSFVCFVFGRADANRSVVLREAGAKWVKDLSILVKGPGKLSGTISSANINEQFAFRQFFLKLKSDLIGPITGIPLKHIADISINILTRLRRNHDESGRGREQIYYVR